MEDELSTNPNFNLIYLYQLKGKKRLSNEACFNYKFIKNKQHIYIDINNNFIIYMNLYFMPNNIKFKQAGKLIGTKNGYMPKYKETFTDELEKLIRIDMENCSS